MVAAELPVGRGLAWLAALVATYRAALAARSREARTGLGTAAALLVGTTTIVILPGRRPGDAIMTALVATVALVVAPMLLDGLVARYRAWRAARTRSRVPEQRSGPDERETTPPRLAWLDRLVQAAVPWALALLVVASAFVFAQGTLSQQAPADQPHLVALFAGTVLLVASAAIVASTQWPLGVLGLVAWLVAGYWPALVVASYYVGARQRRRGVAAGFAAVAAVAGGGRQIGWSLGHGGSELGLVLVVPALMVGLPFVVGSWARARHEVAQRRTDQLTQLRRERTAQIAAARAEERAALAREMHDIVAHRVTLMVLHAGVLEVGTSDERVREASTIIRTTGRQALRELREVLGVLRCGDPSGEATRSTPQPTLDDLDPLIDQARAAGLPVTRVDTPDASTGWGQTVPLAAQRAIHRVVRESLTNVIKHAGPVRTRVELRHLPPLVTVSVVNAAPEMAAPGRLLPGSGLGLVGLRERVEVLGGTFWAGERADGGFAVRARVPLGDGLVDATPGEGDG